uniref:Arrestin_C domain-containing protein n=1 Tax=Rhabditophanes sp. KR3021 TaxID=114890 RepID=A0AC35TNK1_9BILA
MEKSALGKNMHLLMKPVGLDAFLAPLSGNPKGLEDCYIEIEKGNACFRTGQTIKGTLGLVLKDTLKVKSVTISLQGKARCEWHVWETRTTRQYHQRSNQPRREPNPFSSEESYIDEEIQLCTETSLNSGTHKYCFEFKIPDKIPPTFEGVVGHIRYYLKARITRSWKLDHIVKTYLSVIPFMDLTSSEKAQKNIVKEVTRELGFICFKYGMIKVTTNLRKAGYVAGEIIPIQIKIQNNTSKTIQKIDVKLIENVLFIAERASQFKNNRSKKETDKKTESRTIVSLSESVDIACNSDLEKNISISVPSIAPSFMSTYIKVNFYIKIRLSSSNRFFSSINADIPILIGTEPILDGQEQFSQCKKSSASKSKAEPEQQTNQFKCTFKDSFFGKARFDEMDAKEFTPKYLFYEK